MLPGYLFKKGGNAMKIIHQHPPAEAREETLRHLHAACLRALRPYRQAVRTPPGSVRGR